MGASFILQNILASLLPVGVDAAKAVIGKFGGGVRPTNIDEQIKLDGSQVDKLKALATLDNPYGTPSQWVVDLRASFRYLAAAIVIIAGLGVQLVPSVDLAIRLAGLEFSAMAFSFIFGDRVYLNLKK